MLAAETSEKGCGSDLQRRLWLPQKTIQFSDAVSSIFRAKKKKKKKYTLTYS